MDVYLAAPFFNETQLKKEEDVANALEKNKSIDKIFRPKNIVAKNKIGTKEWTKEIFTLDKKHIDNADIVVAIIDFLKIDDEIVLDSGTCWEIGYSFAKNKPVFLVSYEENVENTTLNLMISEGSHYHFVPCKDLTIFDQLKKFDFSVVNNDLFLENHQNWKAI